MLCPHMTPTHTVRCEIWRMLSLNADNMQHTEHKGGLSLPLKPHCISLAAESCDLELPAISTELHHTVCNHQNHPHRGHEG